jgi:hypothetical protein
MRGCQTVLFTKYYLCGQIKDDKTRGIPTGEIRNADKILGGKSEGKTPLGIHRRRRDDNIKIYLNK